jgi:hypothetical protein
MKLAVGVAAVTVVIVIWMLFLTENQKCKARIRFLEGVTNGLWLLFGNDGEQNAMVGKARLVCYVWTEKWGIK